MLFSSFACDKTDNLNIDHELKYEKKYKII